jgi:6-phosphogluconate dehydrogenase (decarboxylating)
MTVDVRHYEPIDTVVQAVEVNGLDLDDIVVWINQESKLKDIVGQTALRGRSAEYIDLQTPEGMLRTNLGDYIVTDGAGQFWKVSRSVFDRSYAPLAPGASEDDDGHGDGE